MAKKIIKKAPAIARTEVTLKDEERPVMIVESYATFRTRCRDSRMFVELRQKTGRPVLLAKDVIKHGMPIM